ncbi:MAG: FAD:protein FMN transferase [Candidatus Eisenbacteria bacterium]|nr:FAD:protein FMN transferase [Candidatus Eisenbacteria bacterium]
MGSRQATLLALGIGIAVLALVLWPRPHWETHSGDTMGTTYHVTWSWSGRASAGDRLRQEIDRELVQVNEQMSSYLEDSEIRRFEEAPAGSWFEVSPETRDVVAEALEVARITDGAFDPTVSPLVRLWGFGRDGRRTTAPDSSEVRAAMSRVGWNRIEVQADPPALRRTDDAIGLDLSAIAKGHGVDRICAVLESAGSESYLVEIGGEVRVHGDGPHGDWRVALEWPEDGGSEGRMETLLLADGAVATSGTYLNRFVSGGTPYHHVIDPRTGYPAGHATAQVTVFAETCQTADARATALLVLGEEAGLALAEREHWAARFLAWTPSSEEPDAGGRSGRRSAGPDARSAEAEGRWREIVSTEFARLERRDGGAAR